MGRRRSSIRKAVPRSTGLGRLCKKERAQLLFYDQCMIRQDFLHSATRLSGRGLTTNFSAWRAGLAFT